MKTKPMFTKLSPTLPDLFQCVSGGRVSTRSDWETRRDEIKRILQDGCYGTLPPAPDSAPVVKQIQPQLSTAEASHLHQYLTFPFADSDFALTLDVYTPNEKSAAPFPVIVCGDACWRRITADYVNLATSRGYALAMFNRCEIVPDYYDYATGAPAKPPRDSVVQRRFPDHNFGAVAAWAWGFSRILDALEQLDFIDATRAVTTGHSRGGKASLLAGAFDERFAVVTDNASGTGGAAGLLVQAEGAEPVAHIVDAFPTWFADSYRRYYDAPHFDAHFLMALCAPRPLLLTESTDDLWANPAGICVMAAEARNAYKLLAADSATPAPNIAMHFRTGRHAHTLDDWRAMFDYCDFVFDNTPLTWDPLDTPYDLEF